MDTTDMTTPVTRGEMRAELERLEQKLEMWGGALLARIDSGEQRLKAGEQRLIERMKAGEQRLIERIDSSERRLLTELARHTRASYEEMSTQISVIDEKYADLPPRVALLERKAFPPRRR
jgi:hypothetical protein